VKVYMAFGDEDEDGEVMQVDRDEAVDRGAEMLVVKDRSGGRATAGWRDVASGILQGALG
jgi:hypothetical protein